MTVLKTEVSGFLLTEAKTVVFRIIEHKNKNKKAVNLEFVFGLRLFHFTGGFGQQTAGRARWKRRSSCRASRKAEMMDEVDFGEVAESDSLKIGKLKIGRLKIDSLAAGRVKGRDGIDDGSAVGRQRRRKNRKRE